MMKERRPPVEGETITQLPRVEESEIPRLERKITKYDNLNNIPELPDLIPTGTKFDEIISDRVTTPEDMEKYFQEYGEEMPKEKVSRGGFTRKCVDITAGPAGSGKTWSRCSLLAKAKRYMREEYGINIRAGFISAEMRESEWAKELKKSKILQELEVDYMLDYVGFDEYQDIFWEAVADYDIVVIDSLPAVISHFKMCPSEKRTEKTMIFDFIREILQSVDKNNNNIQLINQANKDGNYKGGTELPHMMSSLSFVEASGSERATYFVKNRNNGESINKKLYFIKDDNGEIDFNSELFEVTYETKKDSLSSIEEFLTQYNEEKGEQERYEETIEYDENVHDYKSFSSIYKPLRATVQIEGFREPGSDIVHIMSFTIAGEEKKKISDLYKNRDEKLFDWLHYSTQQAFSKEKGEEQETPAKEVQDKKENKQITLDEMIEDIENDLRLHN